MHIKPHRTAAAATAVYLLAVPKPAMANQGLKAMGALVPFLIGGLAVIILTIVNMILASANVPRKRKGMRIANVIMLVPTLALSVGLLSAVPQVGLFGLLISLVIGITIYHGFEKQVE